jgi:hypothetical protein
MAPLIAALAAAAAVVACASAAILPACCQADDGTAFAACACLAAGNTVYGSVPSGEYRLFHWVLTNYTKIAGSSLPCCAAHLRLLS